MESVLFRNAKVVREDGVSQENVYVEDGRIVNIGKLHSCADKEIDCCGKLLMPGAIDTHVHFREPSPNEREDFASGTRSAAAGGVSCVIEHPLDVPPVLDGASCDNKKKVIAPKAYIDYGLWGGVTGKNLDRLSELQEKGVFAYKAFLCASDPLFPMVRDGELLEAMKQIAKLEGIIGLHAENDAMITYYRELQKHNTWEITTHSKMRPVLSELEAIHRALFFAEQTGVKLHILHMGIYEGAVLVKEARKNGVDVTAETCPHYLCLTEQIFEKKGADAKCCPPLRDREHMQRLWEYVFDGTIDMIVSDHSPYTVEEKAAGAQDMLLAPPGITGVQTGLQIMLSEACHKRGMSVEKLSALMSTNAAKRFGLYGRKGAIREGFDADFALVDFERRWKIQKKELYYKNKNSAFADMEGTGKPVATFVRGKCVWNERDGFLQGAGYGHYFKKCDDCYDG